MNRWIATCVAAALTSTVFVGCAASNSYDPQADGTRLSAVAAQAKYPSDMPSKVSPDLIYSVADNGVITLSNSGDMTLTNFNLWVNKNYYLMVTKPLAARSTLTFAPELFFNRDGQTLKDKESVSQLWTLQVQTDGQLWDAKIVKM